MSDRAQLQAWTVVDEGWGRKAVDFATLSEPGNFREYIAYTTGRDWRKATGSWTSHVAADWPSISPVCKGRCAPASTPPIGW